jgi:hypothetical protein
MFYHKRSHKLYISDGNMLLCCLYGDVLFYDMYKVWSYRTINVMEGNNQEPEARDVSLAQLVGQLRQTQCLARQYPKATLIALKWSQARLYLPSGFLVARKCPR